MHPAVISYGTISLDNIIRLPHQPQRAMPTDVTADYYQLGGEALTVAVPLAAWGHRVGVAGTCLGEDPYADFILNELARHPNIEQRWLEREPHVRTPFTRLIVTADGVRYPLRYWFDSVPRQELGEHHLAGARLLSLNGESGRAGLRAARRARALGLTVVAADLYAPDDPLLPLCDWLVLSRARLVARFPEVDPQIHLAHLREATGATLILTDRAGPLTVVQPDWRAMGIPPYPLAALDRMGAGDLFKAGLIHGILSGLPTLEAIRLANAAAALWVAQPPALKRPPTLDEIAALQEERGARPLLGPRERETLCPICRRPIALPLFEKHWEMDRRVVRALRDRHPAWRRADGACPSCVQEVIGAAGLSRVTADLPPSMASHPIYGQGEPQALPIGVRLRANPHYAGRGVTIAFLDSGFYPHPDLLQPSSRILEFVDAGTEEIEVGASFNRPQRASWHGMMTSVVAAGNGFLSDGYYAGLARAASLVLVKVSTPVGYIDEVDILRGLRWVAANRERYGIGVVNISLGGDHGLRPESELNQLVNALVAEGVVVVAAAGNAGRNDLCPPASASGAITVGGLDDGNTLDPTTNRLWTSSWGRLESGQLKPELIAPSIWLAAPVLPGTAIAEQNLILDRLYRASDEELPGLIEQRWQELRLAPTLRDAPVEAQREAVRRLLMDNKFVTPFYQHVDGTSFAAPIVSSIVAQMREANPALTPQRIKELLIATASPLPGVPEERQGYGVVQPGPALAAALHERRGPYSPGDLSPQVGEHCVRFLLREPRARAVSVIGAWNDWTPGTLPMVERDEGVWLAEMARLPVGRYPYKFWLDDERWLDDPENTSKVVDGYGGFSAVLEIEDQG